MCADKVVVFAWLLVNADKSTLPLLVVIDNALSYLVKDDMSKEVAFAKDNVWSDAPFKVVTVANLGADTEVTLTLSFKTNLDADANSGNEISPATSSVSVAIPVNAVKPAVGTTPVSLAV